MKVYTGMEQAETLDSLITLLHEVMGCATATFLMIFFYEVKFFLL